MSCSRLTTAQPSRPQILIVGAGIAGLTLAQALLRRGISFDIVDRVEKPAPVGAGIMLNYNALRLLDALGFGAELRKRGRIFARARIATPQGRVLQKIDASRIIPGAEVLAIHRADLHDVLSRGLQVRWGTSFTHWEQSPHGLTVTLSDGMRQRYALVVGADGLDSSVRVKVFPADHKRYVGYTCWRFVTALGGAQLTDAMEWWGQGRRLGLVNIGQGRCYGYATLNAPAQRQDSVRGRATRLRDLFAGYPEPANEILGSLQDESVIHHDLYELPRHRWQAGRVVLLGDAAHAMTPNLGQGAGMGVEDAVVLAEALRVHGCTEQALNTYVEIRRERVKTVADASRTLGLLGQLEHPALRQVRDAVLGSIPQQLTDAQSRTRLFAGAPAAARY